MKKLRPFVSLGDPFFSVADPRGLRVRAYVYLFIGKL